MKIALGMDHRGVDVARVLTKRLPDDGNRFIHQCGKVNITQRLLTQFGHSSLLARAGFKRSLCSSRLNHLSRAVGKTFKQCIRLSGNGVLAEERQNAYRRPIRRKQAITGKRN